MKKFLKQIRNRLWKILPEKKHEKDFSDFIDLERKGKIRGKFSSGSHGKIWKVSSPSVDDAKFIEKELWSKEESKEGGFSLLSGRRRKHTKVKQWGKYLEELQEGEEKANVPQFVAPDYERNSLFFKFLSAEDFVDCNDYEKLNNVLKENPEVAGKIGEQMAIAHNKGFSQPEDQRPLSSLFLVKNEKDYKPVFVDVMNMEKRGILGKILGKEKKWQAKELDYILDELEEKPGKEFLKAYKEKNPEVGEKIWKERGLEEAEEMQTK